MSTVETELHFHAFLECPRSLDNYNWLGDHIACRLIAAGMPTPLAHETAVGLQEDIVELFAAREQAIGTLSQLAYLDERDHRG